MITTKNAELKKNVVLFDNGPIRLKSQINGRPRLQGVFAMKDRKGFPVDMSYEIAKEKGWDIDWIEAMADALRQCIFKYEGLEEEIKILMPDEFSVIKKMFMLFIMDCEGATASDKAQHLYSKMWDK